MTGTTIDNRMFYKRLWTLALPISFQSLMLAMVAAFDALMLGRVAQEEMTAVSLATQIQFVQNMFLMSGTAAGSILGAQYFGKGDRRTIEELFNLMLRFCGLISVLFFLACELIPGTLMHAFTHDPVLIGIGSAYLRIAGWSYLLTGVSQCYLAVMKFTDHVTPVAWISSSAVIVNIVLNAVFIFGLLGLPRMNARGAALATTLSRVIELGLCIAVSTREGYVRPAWDRFLKGQKQLRKDFTRQCLPLLGASLFWGVGFTSYTAIMGHMGSDAAAGNAVASVVRDLVCCACNGIGSAAGIMVGNALGAGDLERGKAYGIKLKNISWVIGFVSTALVLAVTPLVVRMVILTEEARGYLTGMMVIMAFYMIGRCGVYVGHRNPAGPAGRLCIPLAGAGGLFLHLPGRGGKDPLGDDPPSKIQVGPGPDPGNCLGGGSNDYINRSEGHHRERNAFRIFSYN